MNLTRSQILQAVGHERERQDDMWGDEFDRLNTANDWVAFITRYLARASGDSRRSPGRRTTEGRFEFDTAMVQVAALAVAAIEASKRNGGPAPRHYD